MRVMRGKQAERMFEHNLGDKVRCVISGIEGIITTRAQCLYGCNRYVVTPPAKDGKPVDGVWVDEDAVEMVAPGFIKPRVRVGAVEGKSELRRTGGFDLTLPR